MTDDAALLALERDKLELERVRFESDRELAARRLHQERVDRYVTLGGIAVPILIAAIGLWGNAQAAKTNGDSEFRLKAAELALSGAIGPSTIRQRAQALRDLFPDRLPEQFADQITGGQFLLGTADEFRLRMLEDAVPKAQCAEQVVGLWRDVLGPGKRPDRGRLEWLGELRLDACPNDAATTDQ
jgi:hypothetical protein